MGLVGRGRLRWVAAVVIVVLVGLFLYGAATNPAFRWSVFREYLFNERVLSVGLVNTLQLTIYSMVIAILLGVLLAVMRLSPNPVFKSVSWVYLWIFRGTPVYVQLVFWGLIAIIYQTIDIGIPFMEPWVSFQTTNVLSVFWIAVIGLALNEAAYMAEIVRAGLLSVDRGQEEAAKALGMSWSQTMARVIEREPDLTRVPVQVRRLLKACLEKNRKERLQAIGDVHLLLEDNAARLMVPPPRPYSAV